MQSIPNFAFEDSFLDGDLNVACQDLAISVSHHPPFALETSTELSEVGNWDPLPHQLGPSDGLWDFIPDSSAEFFDFQTDASRITELQSLNEERKRTRRVLRPVKANNSTGQKGKLVCLQCRKRKSKCTYVSLDQDCEFCVQRGYFCHKTWGPKRNSQNQVSTSAPIRISPRSIPFIHDESLSAKELSYLRSLAITIGNTPNFEGPWPVMLQHVWELCGFTFTNSMLLYGLFFINRWEVGLPGFTVPEQLGYISKFEKSIIKAIGCQEIGEIHLLGIFILLISSRPTLSDYFSTDRFQVHLQGFIAVLSHLVGTGDGTDHSVTHCKDQKFRHLYYYLLVHLRYYISFDLMRLGKHVAYLLCQLEHFTEQFTFYSDVADIRVSSIVPPNRLSGLLTQNPTWIGLRGNLDGQCRPILMHVILHIFRPDQVCHQDKKTCDPYHEIARLKQLLSDLYLVATAKLSSPCKRRDEYYLGSPQSFFHHYYGILAIFAAIQCLDPECEKTVFGCEVVHDALRIIDAGGEQKGFCYSFGPVSLLLTDILPWDEEELIELRLQWWGASVREMQEVSSRWNVCYCSRKCLQKIQSLWNSVLLLEDYISILCDEDWIWGTSGDDENVVGEVCWNCGLAEK